MNDLLFWAEAKKLSDALKGFCVFSQIGGYTFFIGLHVGLGWIPSGRTDTSSGSRMNGGIYKAERFVHIPAQWKVVNRFTLHDSLGVNYKRSTQGKSSVLV